MKLSHHLLRPNHENGEVVVKRGKAWSDDDIRNRAQVIQNEEKFRMSIKLSNETIGRSALQVTPNGMSWDDVFSLITSAPRTYADASVTDFVGDDGSQPSVSQIFANLQREAVKRGVIVATARVPKTDKNGKPIPKMKDGKPKMTKAGQPVYVNRSDVFRFGFSKNAADAAKLPKWYRNTAAKLGIDIVRPLTTDLEVVESVDGEEE